MGDAIKPVASDRPQDNRPPSEFVGRMQEVVTHIKAAQQLMANGPLSYYFEKLVEHSYALLTHHTPIKAGHRAVIVHEVKCDNGWRGSERNLAVGQFGVVQSVDYFGGKFRFEFVPDKQWWLDSDEVWQPATSLASYRLSEDVLRAA